MNTIEDFVTLLRDEMGLTVTERDTELSLDEVAGWDSVHLLSLLSILERRTGRSLPLPEILEADSLAGIYALAVSR